MSDKSKKILKGVVVNNKSAKTLVVRVDRRFNHPRYEKIMTASKKYHVHYEGKEKALGEIVTIIESKPHSRLKRWEVYGGNI